MASLFMEKHCYTNYCLKRGTIDEMLEAEMEEHLGYDKHSPAGDLSGNSRNGYNKKTLQTQMGKAEIRVSRDRNGEFEPQLIGKYQTKSNNLEQQVIAIYQKGMSTRDIEDHLRDIDNKQVRLHRFGRRW